MIIWSGLGFVVAIIGFGSLILTEYLSERITNNDQFYQENSWIILIGMALAAIFTFAFSLLLKKEKARVVVDKETGQEIELRKSHSLFWIPVRWWPVVFIILGVVFTFVEIE
ncbi:hypothetical protein P4C99_21980 [Pontiellaceae bacterium B1224]|nr:hypothetical protein [Pontiellaceae bacterium B1224]